MNEPTSNRRRRGKGGRSRRANRASTKHFWDATTAPDELDIGRIRTVSDPDAMVRSLGPPPLPGHARLAAEHYLAAVYDKSVNLAGLLAAAGQLIEVDELLED